MTVSATDAGGGVGKGTSQVSVTDRGPALNSLLMGVYVQGTPFTLVEPFTEPGIADQDTVTINWGDPDSNGNPDIVTLDSHSMYLNSNNVLVPYIVEPTATNSQGTITLGHTYFDAGPHTVSITITDKDGKSSVVTSQYASDVTTTTSVISSTPGNSSVYGQPVTFTATVAAPGFATPSGMVTFDVNGVSEAQVSLNGGVAQFTPSGVLPVGSYTITAFYAGAGNDLPSDNTSSPLIQVVGRDATRTSVASSTAGAPSSFGQSVTFTATVSANSPGAGIPTGTVTFFDGTTALGTGTLATTGGLTTATFTTYALPVGSQSITAQYTSGDGSFTASADSAAMSQVVNKASTLTTVTSSINPTVFGQSTTFTATVSVSAPGTTLVAAPTGTVTFYVGTTVLGTGTLATTGGLTTATFTSYTLPVGSQTITAQYTSGDGNFTGSAVSASIKQAVNKASTSTTITSSIDPTAFGQATIFTATISVAGLGSTRVTSPTGVVTFFDGTIPLGTGTLSTTGGLTTATLTSYVLPVGSQSITAQYTSGDSNFAASAASAALSQVVNKASTSTIVVSSVNTTVFSQSTTFTATVSVNGPGSTRDASPTGTVTFYDGTMTLGTGTLSTNGGLTTATFSTFSLPVGSQSITAQYTSGDGNFAASAASAMLNQVVNKASTSTTVASSINSTVYGQSTTFTATINVNSPGGTESAAPTGTVTFFDGTTQLGQPVAVVTTNGVTTAKLAWSGLTVNSAHTITAAYNGDGNFTAGTGSLNQKVNQDATTTTISASTTLPSLGQAVTFTASVAANAPGAGTPTGTVDFFDTTSGTDEGKVTLVNGTASLTISNLSPGSHAITATYSGDTNFLTSASAQGVTLAVANSVYVLNPTASGALEVTGATVVKTSGLVEVDSNSSSAIIANGSGKVTAGSIQVVGGVSVTGGASLSPKPATGTKAVADPLAGLAVPPVGTARTAVNLGSNNSLTINPGVYSAINVSGNSSLTMNPGIYEITGGGFSVSGSARVNGTGVLIYNAGSNFPSTGGTFGAINFSGAAVVNLSAATTGTYAGIVLFQARDNSKALQFGGSAAPQLNGAVYASAALLSVTGAVQLLQTTIVVNELQLSGSGSTSPISNSSSTMTSSAMVATPQGPLSYTTVGSSTAATGTTAVSSPVSQSSSTSSGMTALSTTPSTTVLGAIAGTSTTPTSQWTVSLAPTEADDETSDLFDLDSLGDLATSLSAEKVTGARVTTASAKS